MLFYSELSGYVWGMDTPDLKFKFANDMSRGWAKVAMGFVDNQPFDMKIGRSNYVTFLFRSDITNEVMCWVYLYRTKTSHVVGVRAMVPYNEKFRLNK